MSRKHSGLHRMMESLGAPQRARLRREPASREESSRQAVVAGAMGKYRLTRKIATGGTAEVWLAFEESTSYPRPLVVKRILPHLADDPELIRMLLSEATIVARFNQPNIVQVLDLGESNGNCFLVMEYVHGESLSGVLQQAWGRKRWMSEAVALRIAAFCCDGLAYAHSLRGEDGKPLRVVHRDVSPQNILIGVDGTVKLTDFGIALAATRNWSTLSGAIKGKFAYMSPEQAGGVAVDHRSDIYSLGLVLYEMLTGERPHQRDSDMATLHAARRGQVAPPSEVVEMSSELDDLVMRALAFSPDDRYTDAVELGAAIEEVLTRMGWEATPGDIASTMNALFDERTGEHRLAPALTDPSFVEPPTGSHDRRRSDDTRILPVLPDLPEEEQEASPRPPSGEPAELEEARALLQAVEPPVDTSPRHVNALRTEPVPEAAPAEPAGMATVEAPAPAAEQGKPSRLGRIAGLARRVPLRAALIRLGLLVYRATSSLAALTRTGARVAWPRLRAAWFKARARLASARRGKRRADRSPGSTP